MAHMSDGHFLGWFAAPGMNERKGGFASSYTQDYEEWSAICQYFTYNEHVRDLSH